MTRESAGGVSPGPARDRRELLGVVARFTWLGRAVVFVVVGVFTFRGTFAAHRDLTVEVVAYTVSAVALAAWAELAFSRGGATPDRRRWLPIVLALLTVIPAATSTGPHAGALWL